jgi:hypothetical protein
MLLHYELRLLGTVPALNVTPLGSGLFRPQPGHLTDDTSARALPVAVAPGAARWTACKRKG